MENEKTYQFTIVIQGTGKTEEEAWADAIEAFESDPGEPQDVEVVDDEDV